MKKMWLWISPIAIAIIIASILAYLKYVAIACDIACPALCHICVDENNATYQSCVRINREKCECEEFPPCKTPYTKAT
jgi:hypothetical protein